MTGEAFRWELARRQRLADAAEARGFARGQLDRPLPWPADAEAQRAIVTALRHLNDAVEKALTSDG